MSVNSPPVKLHELTPPRTTIKCHDACSVMVRIYRVEPSTMVGAYRFCPACGSDNVSVYRSADTDQWEALARDYELPIPVMQQLYRLWNPLEQHRFADFVAEMRKESATATNGTPSTSITGVPQLKVPR